MDGVSINFSLIMEHNSKMGNRTVDSNIFARVNKLKFLRKIVYQELKRQERFEEMIRRYPRVVFSPDVCVDGDCSFGGPVVLSTNVKVTNCNIGANTYIASSSRLSNCDVGNYCSIGPEILAGLGMHPSRSFVSTHPAFFLPQNVSTISYVEEKKFIECKRIKIGSDVWIGARAIILDGVNIEDGAIIAAGAVITQDVDAYSIVGGVPGKEIRKRFSDDEIEFLLRIRWWEKDEEWIRSRANLFNDIQKLVENLT
jgi:acetyltransferase-like isoleucine patch superfamily enzyme